MQNQETDQKLTITSVQMAKMFKAQHSNVLQLINSVLFRLSVDKNYNWYCEKFTTRDNRDAEYIAYVLDKYTSILVASACRSKDKARILADYWQKLEVKIAGRDTAKPEPEFGNPLQLRGVTEEGYALCIDTICCSLLGSTAKELKSNRKLPTHTALVDTITADQYHAIKFAELLARQAVVLYDAHGNTGCHNVFTDVANKVKNMLPYALQ